MAVGFPVKDDYATGDVLTAAQMNDLAGTLNTVPDVIGGFAAGKNKLINADFRINQRAFTSTTTSTTYGFDRWLMLGVDGTTTYSAQTFTAGAAPVAGYEGTNFARLVTTGQTLPSAVSFLSQKIEDVRSLANQTVTVSFWAKAASGTPKIAIELDQQFGSGGSTRVTTAVGQPTITTSWARYSATATVPSISGKTIGTGNSLNTNLFVSAGSDANSRTGSMGIQTNTFDIWGVQVEAGSILTPFQTASGSIAGEIELCRRYFVRYGGNTATEYFGTGQAYGAGSAILYLPHRPFMRATPVGTFAAASNFRVYNSTFGGTTTPTAVAAENYSLMGSTIILTGGSGLTAGNAAFVAAGSTSATLDYSAEL
jgi:hypothetical protein